MQIASRTRGSSARNSVRSQIQQANVKSQLIEAITQNLQPVHKHIHRPSSHRNPNMSSHTSRVSMSKEEIHEENQLLKKSNNQLSEQLRLKKVEVEGLKKKIRAQTRELDVKFEKKQFWGGSHAQIEKGVRNQYDILKDKYDELCAQMDKLARLPSSSNSQEIETYIELLEKENKKLLGICAKVNRNSLDLARLQSLSIENMNLLEQIQRLQDKSRKLKDNNRNNQIKISFLNDLVEARQKSLHEAAKKNKKIEMEIEQLRTSNASLQSENSALSLKASRQISEHKEKNSRQQLIERGVFMNQIEAKDSRIGKLEKEIAFLSTLLAYWKPIQEINSLRNNPDSRILASMSESQDQIKFTPPQHLETALPTFSELQPASEINKSSILETKKLEPKKVEMKRVQQTAQKRHSDNAKKCRRVQERELQGIGQLIRYRCFGANIPLDSVQSQFSWAAQQGLSEQENTWRSQYITMEQAMGILSSPIGIFRLERDEAELFSRYLIEDSDTEYVYCDMKNENLRSIVKSIIRRTLGEYVLLQDYNAVEKRASLLVKRYETNLESQLRQIAPTGFVSKKKLAETFSGFGMEMDAEVSDFIFGRLANHRTAKSLERLPCSALLEI